MPRKGTVKSAGLRATTAPMPQALNQFIDQNAGYGGHTGIGGRSPALVEPPEFRPSSTFAGGVGGGFGTGGGFGSTGGFHTVRAAAWQEPTLIRLNDPEPLPVPEASEWAPSRLAPGVAHMVNKVRANTSGQQKLQGVVDDSLVAGPPQHTGTGDGSQYVMEPERFEFFQVRVPPTTTVMPPPAISRQDRLMAPADRSAILQFEKQKRTADIVLGRDRHRQMRHIALMQRRYPTGVLGVESAATQGTVVYAADRLDAQRKVGPARTRPGERGPDSAGGAARAAQAAAAARQAKGEWLVKNSRSEPHLGYDFMKQVPPGFVPPPGAPERKLWDSRGRNPFPQPPSARVFDTDVIRDYKKEDHRAGRCQNQRNRETDGKPWNIITGCEYSYVQPNDGTYRPAEKSRKMHPSLNTGMPPPHIDVPIPIINNQ